MFEKLHKESHEPSKSPGFNGPPSEIPPRDEEPSFTSTFETHDLPLTARELVMLRVMNDITDEINWHLKLSDDNKVKSWRDEALKIPLMSNKAWDWCMAELKDKAEDFKATGHVLVLNARSGICKSDVAIAGQLQAELSDGIANSLAFSDAEKDGRCNAESRSLLRASRQPFPRGRARGRGGRGGMVSNERGQSAHLSAAPWRTQVMNHVDPSLFPLVYGKTRVMKDTGSPSLSECLDYSGCGRVAAISDPDALHPGTIQDEDNYWKFPSFCTYREHDLEFISRRFQRLPCEVKFKESKEVAITSYINNLHPARFKSIYNPLEKLISAAIQPWNDVLVKTGSFRWPERIRTWGINWSTDPNDGWPTREALLELENDRSSEPFRSMVHRIRNYRLLPDDNERLRGLSDGFSAPDSDDWERQPGGLELAITAKWKRIRQWEHPEPGISLNYTEWKAGKVGNAIVSHPVAISIPDHEYYSVSLMEDFREQGLQVIIKMASIELTPENPCYEDPGWVVDGMLNERIAATAIFYYETNNVTTPGISFRQLTTMRETDLSFDSFLCDALADVFGVSNSEEMLASFEFNEEFSGYQTIGTVSAHQGRLLAWPSTLQHKFRQVQLVDESKPGHARYVILSLVDPYHRICSTKRVPPQRHDWWYDEVVRAAGLKEKGLPQEVINMIGGYTEDWPIGIKEAKNLREEMVKEFHDSMHERSADYHTL